MDKSTYLAAALAKIVTACGTCELTEIKAQLDDEYNGPAVTDEAIERELGLLVAGGVIESFVDGATFWMDAEGA